MVERWIDAMKYESIQEVSLKWNISPRRIRVLCDEGRIEGATKVGSQWVIPIEAQKPKDLRVKSGLYRKDNSNMERISIEKLKDLLVGYGFNEMINYSFVSEKEYDLFGLDKNSDKYK